jgi:O-methyltransferase involved in polyketide biosynthesis
VIVADGLMAFLTQQDMISLLNRLIDHFPSGELAFNGHTRFAIGGKALSRHQVRRGSDQVSWLRRPA